MIDIDKVMRLSTSHKNIGLTDEITYETLVISYWKNRYQMKANNLHVVNVKNMI